jgi:peptidoglycan/xylan/chitin deacetylase (PgdA/CDA1 family)
VALAAAVLNRLGLPPLALAARRVGLWPGCGLTVLLYHRIADPAHLDDLDPELVDATPSQFDAQMAYLARHFRPVGLEEVLAAHREKRTLPPDGVMVTFDDGYLDNYTHALPILLRHGIKAVFFVTTGHVSDRRMFWWERIRLIVTTSSLSSVRIAYPTDEELDLSSPGAKARAVRKMTRIVKDRFGLDLDRFLAELAAACRIDWDEAEWTRRADRALMTWDDVRALRAAGMGIGSHTRSHRVLQTLPPAELAAELTESRATLEARLGEPVTTIAYPVGKSVAALAPVRQAVADAGYELGFTTTPGMNNLAGDEDPYDLRRVAMDRDVPVGLSHLRMTFPFLARHV